LTIAVKCSLFVLQDDQFGHALDNSARADFGDCCSNHSDEGAISLLAISVSNLEEHSVMQLELPLGLEDEERRPGTRKGMARWVADRAMDTIRDRFGWKTVGYRSVALGIARSVPDEFRELAEKDL